VVVSRSGPADFRAIVQTLYWLQTYPSDSYLVADRIASISERVYGPILRGTDVLAGHPLEFGLSKVDAIVYCRTDAPNLTAFNQLDGVNQNYIKIQDAYDTLIERIVNELDIPVYQYDFTKVKASSVWSRVFSGVNPVPRAIRDIEEQANSECLVSGVAGICHLTANHRGPHRFS
jgi:hypothetical protein